MGTEFALVMAKPKDSLRLSITNAQNTGPSDGWEGA
jgi:hypothetical protein